MFAALEKNYYLAAVTIGKFDKISGLGKILSPEKSQLVGDLAMRNRLLRAKLLDEWAWAQSFAPAFLLENDNIELCLEVKKIIFFYLAQLMNISYES